MSLTDTQIRNTKPSEKVISLYDGGGMLLLINPNGSRIFVFWDREMHTDPLKLFGSRLAEIRKSKGWSQEKLALESGIAHSYLGGVERGQRNIALVNIYRLAETLQVKLSYLMDF